MNTHILPEYIVSFRTPSHQQRPGQFAKNLDSTHSSLNSSEGGKKKKNTNNLLKVSFFCCGQVCRYQ